MSTSRIHVLHVVYSFDVGGLENVIVQLINHLPRDRFRHTVLALSTISDFKTRVLAEDVRFIALEKAPGHAVPLYPRIFKILRELRPDVMHTCNLAALELVPLAWMAGVPLRVHAEHGWDAHDLNGQNARYRWMRKLYRPFVHRYVAVSRQIEHYLLRAIGVKRANVLSIPNGVDTERFSPRTQAAPLGYPFDPGRHVVFGTVGRMQTVKNQPLLARAFVHLIRSHPEWADTARLVMVGDGPLFPEVCRVLQEAGLERLAWLPGVRGDVDHILPVLSCFVLPSRAEGTACTLQEAMACGLPAIATHVGGNPDLVQPEINGLLVPSDEVDAMAAAMGRILDRSSDSRAMGIAARRMAVERFSLQSMIQQYEGLFAASI